MRHPKIEYDVKPAGAQRVEEIELLRDVNTAMKQIEAGKVISNRDAKAELRRRFRG